MRAPSLLGGAGDQGAPLHERVRLADVVAAGPRHRHLVVGRALREAREHVPAPWGS